MTKKYYPIFIQYSGHGFSGELLITSVEFFPIPVNHMRQLMKICQMGSCSEDIYLIQIMEDLEYIQEHSAFFSHRAIKMLQNDIKLVRERLDKIGGNYHDN